MKIVLTISEDFTWPGFLVEGSQNQGELGAGVYGRFMACSSFIDAVAKFGTFEYTVVPFNITRETMWQEIKRVLPIEAIKTLEIPKILRNNKVILHELSRHKLSRLANLRKLYSAFPAPVTAQVHGLGSDELLEEMIMMLLSPVCRWDHIVCSSRIVQDVLVMVLERAKVSLQGINNLSIGPQTTHIPLGIDTDFFRPHSQHDARKVFGISDNEFVFLSLGRLSPFDKVDLIPVLTAFREVVRIATQPVRLVISGSDVSGYYTNILQKVTHDYGIEDNVTIIPNVKGTERPLLYSSADFYLAMSDTVNESFGLSVVESLCCGTPVIAADWNGYKELVEEGLNGFKVPVIWSGNLETIESLHLLFPFQHSSLATSQSIAINNDCLIRTMLACIELSSDKLFELGKRALKSGELYSWKNIITQYEKLWASLAEQSCNQTLNKDINITNKIDIFSSYPTQLLSTSDVVELTDLGREVIEANQNLRAYSDLIVTGFNDELAKKILYVALREETTIGTIVSQFAPFSKSDIFRHVLWLLKQWYLRIV